MDLRVLAGLEFIRPKELLHANLDGLLGVRVRVRAGVRPWVYEGQV